MTLSSRGLPDAVSDRVEAPMSASSRLPPFAVSHGPEPSTRAAHGSRPSISLPRRPVILRTRGSWIIDFGRPDGECAHMERPKLPNREAKP